MRQCSSLQAQPKTCAEIKENCLCSMPYLPAATVGCRGLLLSWISLISWLQGLKAHIRRKHAGLPFMYEKAEVRCMCLFLGVGSAVANPIIKCAVSDLRR